MKEVHVIIRAGVIKGQSEWYKGWLCGIEGGVIIDLVSAWQPSNSIKEAVAILKHAVAKWKGNDYSEALSGL